MSLHLKIKIVLKIHMCRYIHYVIYYLLTLFTQLMKKISSLKSTKLVMFMKEFRCHRVALLHFP